MKAIGNNSLHRSALYAEDLRGRATPAEREICRLFDAAKISYVFQSNICDLTSGRIYIADFRIRRPKRGRPAGLPKAAIWTRDDRKLFVEIDGEYHATRAGYDAARTRWIERHRNAVVLRFSNADVFERPDEILASIDRFDPARKTTRVSSTSPSRAAVRRRRLGVLRRKKTAAQA